MCDPRYWPAAAFLLAGVLMSWVVIAASDLDRMQQLAAAQYGSEVAQRVASWRDALTRARTQPDREKLDTVNSYFNRQVRWVEDVQLWRQEDYWASLLETLAQGAGDCEDFAIAKYVTLVLAGVPQERMRLTYVRVQRGQEPVLAHMVLAYYATPGAEPLVLDNLDDTVRPSSQRSDLTPVYAFNAVHLWFQGPAPSRSDPTVRISRWRDVLARMQAEHTL